MNNFENKDVSESDEENNSKNEMLPRQVISSHGSVAVGRDLHGQILILGEGAKLSVIFNGEDLREKELNYLRYLVEYYSFWSDHYVTLAGIVDDVNIYKKDPVSQLIPDQFLPFGFRKINKQSEEDRLEKHRIRFEDIRSTIKSNQKIVILGDPGSGKSTVLWRLVYEYALLAIEDPNSPLPLLIQLNDLGEDVQIEDLLMSRFGQLATYLWSYLASGRVILLLDGLNEISLLVRNKQIIKINNIIKYYKDVKYIFSCRTLDYQNIKFDRFVQVELLELSESSMLSFLCVYLGIDAGYRLFWFLVGNEELRTIWEIWQNETENSENFWTSKTIPYKVGFLLNNKQLKLWQNLRESPPPLFVLGHNPTLLLNIVTINPDNPGELPTNRAHLLEKTVNRFIIGEKEKSSDYWEDEVLQNKWLSTLAYLMQEKFGAGSSANWIWVLSQIRTILPDYNHEKFLELAKREAFLLSVNGKIKFRHELFQEYFSSCELKTRILEGRQITNLWNAGNWMEPSGWEDTIEILIEDEKDQATLLIEDIAHDNPIMAARCLLGVNSKIDLSAAKEKLSVILLKSLIDAERKEIQIRVKCGEFLGILGDPRFDSSMCFLPKEPLLGFVEIPAGPFIMGSDPEQDPSCDSDEFTQHLVNLPIFYISRYLVTVASFKAFVQETGYSFSYTKLVGSILNAPITRVSIVDALAYCKWINTKLSGFMKNISHERRMANVRFWDGIERGNLIVTIPSEAEWEKAARGMDGRIYPWGSDFNFVHANLGETGVLSVSSVGCFPDGVSPYGILDMSGNVWEWTRTSYGYPYPYLSMDGREKLEIGNIDNGDKVQRGGSFLSDLRLARCAFRAWGLPPDGYLGFRLAVSSVV